jgi:RNA polymerase sigma-70 factor, ECF subfamily
MVDWSVILEEHGPAVWRTVYRLVGQQADALDCYQETFLAAYQSAARRPVNHWPSFLVSLATRRAVDHLRRKGRSRSRFAPLDGVPEPLSERDSPVEHAQGAERLNQIRAMLAGLPEKQAEVFWLSGVEEMSHRDISLQMDISPEQVRVLLHRARTRLRAALGTQLPDPRAR